MSHLELLRLLKELAGVAAYYRVFVIANGTLVGVVGVVSLVGVTVVVSAVSMLMMNVCLVVIMMDVSKPPH